MGNPLDMITEDQRDDPTEGLGRIMIYRDPAPQGDNLVPANGNKLTQAVAPEPQGDLAANIAKLRELVANFGTGILDQLGVAGMQPGPKREAAVTGRNAMLGIGDEQNLPWPQRMIRSGATLPGDVASGTQPVVDPETGRTSGRLIERTQDLAGLAGGGALTERPGVATLGSGPTRSNIGNVAMKPTEPAPVFYSALEHAVTNSAQKTASPDQWLGFLKNQPGVKAEELQWTGIGDWLKEQKGPVPKEKVQQYLDAHKTEIKDVTRSDSSLDLDAAREQFMEDRGHEPHSEQELRDYAQEASEYMDSDEFGPATKHSPYQLPGGENYREHLLTLPRKKSPISPEQAAKDLNDFRVEMQNKYGTEQWVPKAQKVNPEDYTKYLKLTKNHTEAIHPDNTTMQGEYQSSHWDEPNVLAHVRTNDRDVSGKKSLHIEEIQSDWHQQGRKQGYREDRNQADQVENELKGLGYKIGTGRRLVTLEGKDVDPIRAPDNIADLFHKWLDESNKDYKARTGVPDAPFKTTWPELALKRMIRHAAENGYDRISWTPGEAQAARYDLSKHIGSVEYTKFKNMTSTGHHAFRNVKVFDPDGKLVFKQGDGVAADLEPVLGKELVQKMIEEQGETQGQKKVMSGLDLKVGGEGMREFYDKMLPKMAEKIGKAHGVKVKTAKIESGVNQAYEGPEFTAEALRNKVGELNRSNTPVSITNQLADVIKEMKKGTPFKEAVESHGSSALMEKLGGARVDKPKHEPVHYFDLPQSLREHAVGKGFPLYMSGIPFPLTPVDHDPFEKERK